MKFKYFGHDIVVLHEADIRKARGPFRILNDPEVRSAFMMDVNDLVARAPFRLIASAIQKQRLTDQYIAAENPYHLALAFGLERLTLHLQGLGARGTTYVVVEARGKKEDAELELEFRRVCAGANWRGEVLQLDLVFADKKTNSAGLQLADLIARPIGRKILDQAQPNRAYEVIRPKFRRSPDGRVPGWGLKLFP